MKTTQNDAAGTQHDSHDSNGSDAKVIIDPSVLAEAQGAAPEAVADTADTAKVEKTEAMPIPPVAAGSADSAAAAPPADKAGEGKDDDEPSIPVNDGKSLKYGLAAAAILGVIALFGVGYMVVRNSSATTPTVAVPASAPAAPVSTLPEVRTPAPRLIDATGCRRGQYRIEGNQLVFTNCATLELSEPAR